MEEDWASEGDEIVEVENNTPNPFEEQVFDLIGRYVVTRLGRQKINLF